MNRLTVSMIVKNEERYLRDCLDSVKEVADEIVIVDTGSTDSTKAIAEEFKAKIYNFKWIDDFSAARNYALSKSTGEWILYIDADERLNKDSISELKKIICKGKKTGVWCTVKSDDKINGKPNIMKYVRLFSNHTQIRFSGRVHEQIIHSLVKNNYKLVHSKITIIHKGYEVSEEGIKKKAERNLKLLLNDYKEEKLSYTAFQLGQTYALLHDYDNAVYYFSEALQDNYLLSDYKAISLRFIAGQERKNDRLEQAYELIMQALRVNDRQPLVNLVASQIYSDLGRIEEAVVYCRKAYDQNNKLLNGITSGDFDLMVEPVLIIYQGIEYALKSKNKESFNYYFNELSKQNKNERNDDAYIELQLLSKLFNNEKINGNEIVRYTKIINQKNISVIINLLEGYQYRKIKSELLKSACVNSNHSITVINQCAALLSEEGNTEEAIALLDRTIENDTCNPTTLFYLIAFNVQNENFRRIIELINKSEDKFGHFPEVKKRLEILKNKLNAV